MPKRFNRLQLRNIKNRTTQAYIKNQQVRKLGVKIAQAFEEFKQRIERGILMRLKTAGELFITYAKENTPEKGGFKDQTGNLRSSIGYVILKDGNVIFESFPGVTKEGVTAGRKAITEAIGEYKNHKGFVFIGVAGMEYGIFVESKGIDVISGSSYKIINTITKSLKELQENMKRA